MNLSILQMQVRYGLLLFVILLFSPISQAAGLLQPRDLASARPAGPRPAALTKSRLLKTLRSMTAFLRAARRGRLTATTHILHRAPGARKRRVRPGPRGPVCGWNRKAGCASLVRKGHTCGGVTCIRHAVGS